MRNTQESGQILRSKKRPRRTLRSGRGSRTNSNTSRQIPARVIDAAYDALAATGFRAETRAQPSIGPLTADLNLPADFFRPSLSADPADNPEVALQEKDRGELLRRALIRLSPEHRQVIDLVYYYEKSVDEVAQILDVPPATVKTRMFYARKKLAELV